MLTTRSRTTVETASGFIAWIDMAVAVNLPENWPSSNNNMSKAVFKRFDWTPAAPHERNPDLTLRRFLISLRMPDRDDHALPNKLNIVNTQRHKFAPAEGSGKADQQQRLVASIFGSVSKFGEDGEQIFLNGAVVRFSITKAQRFSGSIFHRDQIS